MVIIDTKVKKEGLTFCGKFSEGLMEEWLKVVKVLPPTMEIHDNLLFQVGFSLYKLVQGEEDNYRVVAVDYESNPFDNFTDDLTIALWIQSEQGEFLKKSSVNPKEIRYDDKVIISKNVLQNQNYYLQRQSSATKGDSGWFIGYRDKDNDDLVSIYAYELLSKNPNLIKILQLPEDYLVIVDNKSVSVILNEKDEEIDF